MNLNRLENLHRDVLFYFALEFDLSTVFNLCRTSKNLNQKLCQSDEFWSQKLFHDYKILPKIIGDKSKSKYIVRLLNQYKDPRFISLVKGNKLKQDDMDDMLIHMADEGKIDIVKYLIEKGANISAQDNMALSRAVSNGHLEVIRLLLENGIEPSGVIFIAAKNGRLDIVRLLLDYGATIKAQDDSALIVAALNGHVDVVRLFLQHGAILLPDTLKPTTDFTPEILRLFQEHY